MADPVTPGAALAKLLKDADVVGTRVFERGKLARFAEKATLPYITWFDPIADGPALQGDCDVLAETRLLQVSLWQKMADEDADLYRALKGVINGANLNGLEPSDAPSKQHVYQCRVQDGQRLDDPQPGLVQHAITVRLTCAP